MAKKKIAPKKSTTVVKSTPSVVSSPVVSTPLKETKSLVKPQVSKLFVQIEVISVDGYVKEINAMQLHNGCLIRVSTSKNGSMAEALTFVPNVKIHTDDKGNKYIA